MKKLLLFPLLVYRNLCLSSGVFCISACTVGVLAETKFALLFQTDSAACFRGLEPVASQSRLVSSYSGQTQCLGRRQWGTPWTIWVSGGDAWHVKYHNITESNCAIFADNWLKVLTPSVPSLITSWTSFKSVPSHLFIMIILFLANIRKVCGFSSEICLWLVGFYIYELLMKNGGFYCRTINVFYLQEDPSLLDRMHGQRK